MTDLEQTTLVEWRKQPDGSFTPVRTPGQRASATTGGTPGPPGPAGPVGPAGPEGLNWRGDWNSSTTYAIDDAVYGSDGSSYVAIAASTNENPAAAAVVELVLVSPLTSTWGTDSELDHIQSVQFSQPVHLASLVFVEATATAGALFTVKVSPNSSMTPLLHSSTVAATGTPGALLTVPTGIDLAAGTPYWVEVSSSSGTIRLAGGGSYVPSGAYRDGAYTMHLITVGVSDRTDRGMLLQLNGVPNPKWHLLAQHGATGATGPAGATGATGPPGATGATGPAGPGQTTMQTYTPTVTGTGFALGNGTVVGEYVVHDQICWFHVLLTLGSTSTPGTGQLSFGLPFTCDSGRVTVSATTRVSTTTYPMLGEIGSGGTAAVLRRWPGADGVLSSYIPGSGTPVNIASGSIIDVQGWYRVPAGSA